MKTTHLITTLAACHLFGTTAFALTPFSDNFNATALKSTRWTLKNYAKGKLSLSGGKFNFTVSGPTGDDFSTLELKNNRPSYNESWEVILDVANTSGQGDKVGTGILIYNADDDGDQVGLEFNGKGRSGGFVMLGNTNDQDNPQQDIRVDPSVTKGSLKISFDKSATLFTFWYDSTGSTDGLAWTRLGTFSPTGTGGDRRGNWNMNPNNGRFGIQLFGFSDGRTVTAGKVSFDNFKLKAVQ